MVFAVTNTAIGCRWDDAAQPVLVATIRRLEPVFFSSDMVSDLLHALFEKYRSDRTHKYVEREITPYLSELLARYKDLRYRSLSEQTCFMITDHCIHGDEYIFMLSQPSGRRVPRSPAGRAAEGAREALRDEPRKSIILISFCIHWIYCTIILLSPFRFFSLVTFPWA
jgi:hypothetical protein